MANIPLRLAVFVGLTDLLKTITLANGYKHDVSEGVYRGRMLFGTKDPLPFLSIFEPPTPTDTLDSAPSNAATYGDFPIIIQGFAKDDPLNPTDPAHLLMADVGRCLGLHKKANAGGRPDMPQNLLGLKRAVTKLDVGRGIVRPPEDGVSSTAFFWQFITLGFAEKLDDPYGWDQ